MATYWVSTLAPNDLGAGTSYATAKLTIAAAIPLMNAKGDILNIVNDGNHTWTVSGTGTSIQIPGVPPTSFTDFGVLIRGANSSGNPAQTMIEAKAADGDVGRTLIRTAHGTGYVIIRNLTFDSSNTTTNAQQHSVVTFHDDGAPDPGPHRYEGCEWLTTLGTKPTGVRVATRVTAVPSAPDGLHISEFVGCYFQNTRGDVLDGANNTGRSYKTFDNCLVYRDWTSGINEKWFSFGNDESSSATLRVKNCTFYEVIGNNTFVPVIDFDADNGTNVGLVDVYNNVVFVDSTNVDPDIVFFGGNGAAVTKTGTIGFNVLLGGPNTTVGDISDTQLWYETPWDTGTDPMANDSVAYSQAEATIFNAPGSTYAWDPLGNGVTITVAKDLRLLLYRTAGQGGALPGALPTIDTDLSIDVVASTLTPDPLEIFTITVTVANTLVDETGVTAQVAIPDGLTYISHIASAGTWNSGTGIWTIGNLNTSTAVTLVLSVKPWLKSANQSIVFPVSITGFTPPFDSNLGNNTDSLTIMVGTTEKLLLVLSPSEVEKV